MKTIDEYVKTQRRLAVFFYVLGACLLLLLFLISATASAAVFLICCALFLFICGASSHSTAQTAMKIHKQIQAKVYSIPQIAASLSYRTKSGESLILSTLRQMIRAGVFPDAAIDETNKLFLPHAPPPEPLKSSQKAISCPNCAAVVTLSGGIGKCDYCGMPVSD